MNVELPVCPVRESGTGCARAAKKRSGVRGAVWSLTGIIKIRADDEREGRETQCEKVKLTQTLSITFHLTRADDNVDTADDAEARHKREGGKEWRLAGCMGTEHHKLRWVKGGCVCACVWRDVYVSVSPMSVRDDELFI